MTQKTVQVSDNIKVSRLREYRYGDLTEGLRIEVEGDDFLPKRTITLTKRGASCSTSTYYNMAVEESLQDDSTASILVEIEAFAGDHSDLRSWERAFFWKGNETLPSPTIKTACTLLDINRDLIFRADNCFDTIAEEEIYMKHIQLLAGKPVLQYLVDGGKTYFLEGAALTVSVRQKPDKTLKKMVVVEYTPLQFQSEITFKRTLIVKQLKLNDAAFEYLTFELNEAERIAESKVRHSEILIEAQLPYAGKITGKKSIGDEKTALGGDCLIDAMTFAYHLLEIAQMDETLPDDERTKVLERMQMAPSAY